jgi:hypothetical protein
LQAYSVGELIEVYHYHPVLLTLSNPLLAVSQLITDPATQAVVAGLFGFGYLAWNLIEIITMLRDPHKRAFHDKISGTVVVRGR